MTIFLPAAYMLADDVVAAAQRQALGILLGGGLDATGKDMWLRTRVSEGMSAAEIFADALELMEA